MSDTELILNYYLVFVIIDDPTFMKWYRYFPPNIY